MIVILTCHSRGGIIILSIYDVLISVAISILYVLTFQVQKRFFSDSYFSLGELLTEFDTGIKWGKLTLRILLTFTISIAFLLFSQDSLVVILGITMGSILIVWPVFLSETNIPPSLFKHKKLYKTILIIFVFANTVIALLANSIYEFFLSFPSDSTIYNLIIQVILALFSQWLYAMLSNKLNDSVQEEQMQFNETEIVDEFTHDHFELFKYDSDILFNNKVDYYKNKIISSIEFNDKELSLIYKYSNENEVEYSYVLAILTLEKLNRGDFITKFKEKVSVNFIPNYTIKQNPSLGLGQIRVTTAKKYFPHISELELQKSLLNIEFNISLCARIIKDFHSDVNLNDTELSLVKLYTTGDSSADINNSIRIYYQLFIWLIKKNF